jgi:tripeptidyl-peptidase I
MLIYAYGLSHRYGAHLSKGQVAELIAPDPHALELVISWLTHHRVHSSSISITHGGGWLTVSKVPLAQANALLGASYQLYRHVETNEIILRTINYALPSTLHEHIETVAPTTYFGSPRALRQNLRLVPNGSTLLKGTSEPFHMAAAGIPGSSAPHQSLNIVTPALLRRLYGTEKYEPQSAGENKLGIVGYLQQFASQSDLTVFMRRFRPDADPEQATFSVVTVNGGINDQNHPTAEVRRISREGVRYS